MSLLAVMVLAAGCFSPHYENGKLACAAEPHQCPDGYHCAIDHACWYGHDDPRPSHTVRLVLGAGGGDVASEQYRAITSFGQLAGESGAAGGHSVEFGILAARANK
jgi:hypothetical protein